MTDLAQIAHDTYHAAVAGPKAIGDAALPLFKHQAEHVRAAWQLVVEKVQAAEAMVDTVEDKVEDAITTAAAIGQ